MATGRELYIGRRSKHLLLNRRRSLHYVGAAIGLVGAYAVFRAWSLRGHADPWTYFFDPWITMGTLVVAVLLGVATWMGELPKRLNVHFVWEGKYALTCWEASLADTGDIRAWAQQVGRQMCGTMLDFDPFPEITGPRVEGERGRPLRNVYEVTIRLTKDAPSEGYLVWGPDPGQSARSAVRPTDPLRVEQLESLRPAVPVVVEPPPAPSAPETDVAVEGVSLGRTGSVLTVALPQGRAGDELVVQARDAIERLESDGGLSGGGLLALNGRCTVPMAILLGHALAHTFSAVAMWEPKLDVYIVCISHTPEFRVGQRIEAEDVPANTTADPVQPPKEG